MVFIISSFLRGEKAQNALLLIFFSLLWITNYHTIKQLNPQLPLTVLLPRSVNRC